MTNNSKVHVKFFAIFREYVGLKEDWAEIEPGTTVEALWKKYAANAKNPRVINIRAAYSVNQRLAKPETELRGGEEVGFLPPVSGGAGRQDEKGSQHSERSHAPSRRAQPKNANPSTARQPRVGRSTQDGEKRFSERSFLVTSRKLSLAALIKKVEHPGAGAITTFSGVVRDNAHDKSVKFLEYEAYAELAEKTMQQIGDEVAARWHDVRLAMSHRTGHLDIGEASVMIAASAPHRAEAFAACRYAIERIKVILPVWKKEFATDDDYWVEGPVAGEMTPEQAENVARQSSAAYEANVPHGTAGNDLSQAFDFPDAEEVDRLRQLTVAKRVRAQLDAQVFLRGIIRARLRRMYPNLSRREITLKMFEELRHDG